MENGLAAKRWPSRSSCWMVTVVVGFNWTRSPAERGSTAIAALSDGHGKQAAVEMGLSEAVITFWR